MQGANKKGGKLPKKLKLVADEAITTEANTDEDSDHDTVHERSVVDTTSSCKPVRDDPTTGSATHETINNLITFQKKNWYGRNADSPPRDRRDFHEQFRNGLDLAKSKLYRMDSKKYRSQVQESTLQRRSTIALPTT